MPHPIGYGKGKNDETPSTNHQTETYPVEKKKDVVRGAAP
jgi:hypothetical protein